ncbi:transporter substrate-binding domain-containing protein [Desulfococcaceae bacterium HSG8]|nr:transporter substrate-binding domain-containing protein [Desulfococcaceae bacterium HSG8]
MKKTICPMITVAMLFLIGSELCFADQTLKVAFGDALPPWVIPETDNGIAIDIMKETLEPAGYVIKPVYVPYARRLISYKYGKVDAVCDVNPNIIRDSELEGYFSVIAYAYENIGVSLKKKGYSFSKISDLADYSVVSWQGAKAAIGGEYADMANKNKKYRELAKQKTQIKLLYMGREDVIQLDRQIFRYFRKKVSEEGKIDTDQPVDIFSLFGKNKCGFLFRDRNARNAFDKNFAKLKASGRYEKLFEKYTE